MIILKVTKKQGFTLSLEDTIFEKPQKPETFLVLKKLKCLAVMLNIFEFSRVLQNVES